VHDLLNIVILLGAAQGAILAVGLAWRPQDRPANRLLAVLVAAVSLMLLFGVLERGWGSSQPHLLGLGAPLPFLFGPLLYLYIVALTRPAARLEPRWLIHGIPFAAFVLYMLQIFYLHTGGEKIAMVRAYGAGDIPVGLRLLEFVRLVQAVCYLAASWVALRRYGRKIEGYFSDVARIDLRWLRAMVVAHAVVWSIVVVSGLLQAGGVAPASLHGFSRAIQVASALVIFATGYFSLWQPTLFEKAQASRAAEPPPRPLPKYQRNRLEDEEAEAIARKVTARMTERKLYRDGSLTLQALADEVGVTPHMLSQVLNLHLRKSFFVFVNSYRTEELMRALSDPRQRDRGVLELALEAGFNSKSTLNSFFKRYTGLTPSEFRMRRPPAKTPQISAG